MPVKKIEERLTRQLYCDCKKINLMLREQPSLMEKASGSVDLLEKKPEGILEKLSQQMTDDFPELKQVDYEVRYVHPSMQDYLSPAFYLTPPLDMGSPNVIYINPAGDSSNLELFTTLAHEGFPGHLYQTVFFGRRKPADIRYVLGTAGDAEGWATYIEELAHWYGAS